MEEILKAVVTAMLPIIVALIYKWLGIQQNAQAMQVVNTAVARAAGVTYAASVAQMPSFGASASDDAYNRVAESAARLGVNANQFSQMVAGERGRLLAIDPNTSIPTGG